jgi:hypothetical protein
MAYQYIDKLSCYISDDTAQNVPLQTLHHIIYLYRQVPHADPTKVPHRVSTWMRVLNVAVKHHFQVLGCAIVSLLVRFHAGGVQRLNIGVQFSDKVIQSLQS